MCSVVVVCVILFFFFNDTATTEIYTLSLHDALPIWPFSFGGPDDLTQTARHDRCNGTRGMTMARSVRWGVLSTAKIGVDRKSTRLNSSHANISYAVFCLKKKKKKV